MLLLIYSQDSQIKQKGIIIMSEQNIGNGNRLIPPISSREIRFSDGSKNLVWDKIGDDYDFNGSYETNQPGLFDPIKVIGVKVDYDNAEKPYTTHIVFFDGGDSIVRIDTDAETKRSVVYHIDDDSALQIAELFASAPMTIGSRPSRLAGGRLAQVMATAPHEHNEGPSPEAVGKNNPLTFATELQRSRVVFKGYK